MALEARGMEQDVEDGEISDSDSDMPVAAAPPPVPLPPKPQNDNNAARPFQSNISGCAPTIPYRTIKSVDSSEDSFSDSDDDSFWKRKRQKCFNLPPVKQEPFQFNQSQQKQTTAVGGRKINNIWGSVLQEQSQDAVATELGILGMEGSIDKSRQSETYNYLLAKKLMKQAQEEVESLDKELEEYMQDDKKSVAKEEENGKGHLKRKRPVKERVGERQEMNYKGRYEITEDDSEEKVADEIAYRLREPKKDLIVRVVKIIGTRKAIELLMETAEVEQNGGLFVVNGSRRRTPGGVYLNLLKNTPSIKEEQIKEIFYVENQKEYENKKAAKKRRVQVLGKKMKQAIKGLNLQEYDDASRETFASDTNEALASLDDLQEGHSEIKMEGHSEIKMDPEDTIEMDNAHDLEIF
ncbi:phosphorylated adapter RNA export protein isoform X2 [Alligator mississippiensis]|uniref:Phosphorylated adapter RNA export protein n=1 Tax=Alligator mississippiensis TaxID=8496 RepID=A0A151M7V3_ALLMI|nr:phosphorylated adapter RNA export protein isoform X2 [Alligator mississippiensis]KYO20594.1 phosphorylated adapter RNA export protein [Alligator mississippiensis]